jgi:hypothetical protein
MRQTIVLGLYGGSGIGKSCLAAEIFVDLKKQGKSVELVTEYVKSWAWEQRSPAGLENSLYIFGKQLRRESILYGKVDFIVTDCPLGLCAAYEIFYEGETRTVVRDLFRAVRAQQELEGKVKHLDFQLMRQHEFKPEGRYETEEGARRVDGIIRNLIPAHPVKTAKDVLEVLTHYRRDIG